MVWNSIFPVGTLSVKQNRTVGEQNTTYIETTMGNSAVGTNTNSTRDHFWNVGSNEDGRHRFIQSPAFTVGGNPTDPVLGTGMDSVLYAKLTNAQVEWFSRNSTGIYQFIPNVLTGSVVVPVASYGTLTSVPANVYGSIFAYTTSLAESSVQTGFFRSNGTTVQCWSNFFRINSSSSPTTVLSFGNGTEASGLNIRGRSSTAFAPDPTWNYIIKYRAL